jgi:pimeloyl-ACP methyl ester carboxylesterase
VTLPAYHPFRSEKAKAEYEALLAERAKAWPVPGETRVVETPAGQTFARVSGRAGAPPLVLLPGIRGTSLTWIPNIAALSEHYRTYALDTIYDIGLSSRRRKQMTRADLVPWLDEVVCALAGQGRVRLVGLSFGGWLASQYALAHPDRLERVVMLAPAATLEPLPAAYIWRGLMTLLPTRDARQRFYFWLLRDAVESGAAGKAFVAEAAADWGVAERCFAPLPLIAATVLSDEALLRIRVPALILIGQNEKVYSAEKAVSRVRRVAPQIRVEVIPRAGHDLWLSQAAVVTKKVLDFLAEGGTEASGT